MFKDNEIWKPESCLNKAAYNEMIFVLRAHDAAAPIAIRAWCDERIRMGKNNKGDAQINEALQCAETMEKQRSQGF